jgi:ankyrin repeat protein
VLLQGGANPDRAPVVASDHPLFKGSVPGLTPLQIVLLPESLVAKVDPPMRFQWVRLFVEMGARVNLFNHRVAPPYLDYLDSTEPLYLALMHISPPDLEVAKFLITHGANVNAQDFGGYSLLKAAKDPVVIDLLRKAGAHD